MVQESSILEKDFIFLVQTRNQNLEHLLSSAVNKKNIRLELVESFANLNEQRLKGQIIAFVIGSDVRDPIQSAQRLHAFNKSAKIILLSKTDKKAETLKEVIKFSPFIGTEVFCLAESNEAELKQKLTEILQDSIQAEKYRTIITKTNSQISLTASAQESAFNQLFINRLMDIAPIGIAIVDPNGKILGWNREAASIFKKNEAQVLGTPLSQYFDQLEGNKLEDYLRQSSKKRNTELVNPLSLERESQDTSKQVLSFTAAPFAYSGVAEKAIILAIKDITQNIELINRLKKEVTARDNFLSMASHELRTPLTVMRINLDLLQAATKQNVSGTPDLLQLSNKSLKQADQLNDLIEDLFDIAKIHAGKLDFKLVKFNLSEFVNSYMMETEEKFKEANCELGLNIEPNVVGIWDKDRIQQAFANLIDNTLKYASNDPVNIILKTTGNWACLSVQDQGPGIVKKKQEKIFDRFERGLASESVSGLGLGLFIAKKIVEGHAGNIQVQSAPGKGSTFTMKLPLNLDPEKQPEDLGILW